MGLSGHEGGWAWGGWYGWKLTWHGYALGAAHDHHVRELQSV